MRILLPQLAHANKLGMVIFIFAERRRLLRVLEVLNLGTAIDLPSQKFRRQS